MPEKLTWLLELNAKLDGAIQMTRELQRTEDATRKTRTGFEKLEKAAEHAADKISDKIKDWAKDAGKFALGQIFADSFEGALEKVAEFGHEIYTAADETKKLDRAFGYFLDSKAKGEHFEWLEKVADMVPGTTDDLKRMQIGMLELGMPLKNVNDAMLGALDVGVMSGDKDPVVKARAAAEALAGIYRTGRISKGTFEQLGLTGEASFDALSKAMGKSRKEITKLMNEGGKVDKLQAINSILVAIQEKEKGGLGKAALAGGADLSERIRDLKSAIVDPFRDAFMEIEPGVADLVHSIAKQFKGGMGAEIKGLFKEIEDTARSIDWVGTAKNLLAVLEGALKVAVGIGKAMGWVADAVVAATETVTSSPEGGPLTTRDGKRIYGAGEPTHEAKGTAAERRAAIRRNRLGPGPWENAPFSMMEGVPGGGAGVTAPSIPAPSSYMRPGAARGDVKVEINVPISVQGGGPNAGKDIGDHLQKILPGMLHGELQRMATHAGV